jgi:hypothetical protein
MIIDELYTEMVTAHLKANHYSSEWHRNKARINDYCDRNKYTEDQRRKKMSIDWGLNDAMDAYKWWRDEENRLNAAIQTEILMEEHRRLQALRQAKGI